MLKEKKRHEGICGYIIPYGINNAGWSSSVL